MDELNRNFYTQHGMVMANEGNIINDLNTDEISEMLIPMKNDMQTLDDCFNKLKVLSDVNSFQTLVNLLQNMSL